MWIGQIASIFLFVTLGIHAVTLSDFPQCAQDCQSGLLDQAGRSETDLNFICKTADFLASVESCEAQNCSPADLARVFTLAIQLCEPVGGTITIGLANLSACAQPGLEIYTAESGCSPTNWTCICSNPAYTVEAAGYETKHCSAADRQAVLTYTSAACSAVGVEPIPPVPGAANITTLLTDPEPSIFELPDCAQPCLDAALLQSGCAPTDWECICINPAFVGGPSAFCQLQNCGVEDQKTILNYTGAQCSPIGEALVAATTITPTPSVGTNIVAPLQVATVPLVFPTGNVPGAVPTFFNLPACAQFCATNATTKASGSVSDLELLCRNGAVLRSIGACEAALCSPTDQITAFILSGKLCEPARGVASIDPVVNPSAQASIVASALYPTATTVTSLNDYPACAKPCLITPFKESGCALEDTLCVCTSPAFQGRVSCEAKSCGIEDLQRVFEFTIPQCEAVGVKLPPSAISLASKIAYGEPTSLDSVQTPTNLANSAINVLSLPDCAARCIYEAASRAGCSIYNRTCICTKQIFNAYVNTCQAATCTGSELQAIASYATAFCAPVPGHLTATLGGSSLSSYLADATYSAPSPPVATNAPNNISALPICAQQCVYSAAAKANCSSINDLTCICQDPVFLSSVGSCELDSCSQAGQQVTLAYSQGLCAPLGGIRGIPTNTTSTNATSTGVTPFTGGAISLYIGRSVMEYVVGMMGWLLWTL